MTTERAACGRRKVSAAAGGNTVQNLASCPHVSSRRRWPGNDWSDESTTRAGRGHELLRGCSAGLLPNTPLARFLSPPHVVVSPQNRLKDDIYSRGERNREVCVLKRGPTWRFFTFPPARFHFTRPNHSSLYSALRVLRQGSREQQSLH